MSFVIPIILSLPIVMLTGFSICEQSLRNEMQWQENFPHRVEVTLGIYCARKYLIYTIIEKSEVSIAI